MKLSKSESKDFHKRIFGSVGRVTFNAILILISFDDAMKYPITKTSYISEVFLMSALFVFCTSAFRLYYAILDLIVACIMLIKDKSSK